MTTSMLSKYAGETVVAIGAHPDDLELSMGGTLAKLSDLGARVLMVIVCVPSEMQARIEESQRSAAILGGELHVLRKDACCRVEDLKTYELVSLIDQVVHKYEPAVLFSHGTRDLHKDHNLVNHACIAAQRLRQFDFFTYYPTICRPVSIPFFPQLFVDITETIDRKVKAIDVFASHFSEGMICTASFQQIAQEQGRVAGYRYAEGLEIVRIRA